jgi:uncharacterized membrane protein
LVFLAQALYHAHEVAILPVELLYAFRIALESLDTHFMTARDLMLMVLKVLGYFCWIVLIKEADGADSRGPLNGLRGRSHIIAAYLCPNGISEGGPF